MVPPAHKEGTDSKGWRKVSLLADWKFETQVKVVIKNVKVKFFDL